MVYNASGFEWRPERPEGASFVEQKWGWSAYEPGKCDADGKWGWAAYKPGKCGAREPGHRVMAVLRAWLR